MALSSGTRLLFYKLCIISRCFTYGKEEKLKSRKLIELLFAEGKSQSAYPLKVLYEIIENDKVSLIAGVTVSSRRFKKAVDRNRIKRIVRETYRLQKLPISEALSKKGTCLALFFIYTGKDLPIFHEVFEKMKSVLRKVHDEIISLHLKS